MNTQFDTSKLAHDFSETGLKLVGNYENDRNYVYRELYKAIIREVYDVEDVICGHHLIYSKRDKHADGFIYEVVEEIPSADALIFDHDIARKLWGDGFQEILTRLACEPIETRDQLLATLYEERNRIAAAKAAA